MHVLQPTKTLNIPCSELGADKQQNRKHRFVSSSCLCEGQSACSPTLSLGVLLPTQQSWRSIIFQTREPFKPGKIQCIATQWPGHRQQRLRRACHQFLLRMPPTIQIEPANLQSRPSASMSTQTQQQEVATPDNLGRPWHQARSVTRDHRRERHQT